MGMLTLVLMPIVDTKERQIIDNEKKAQAVGTNAAIATVKALAGTNPGPCVVITFDCGANSRAMNDALKVFKTTLPETAAMFFGADDKSVAVLSYVPPV